MIKKIAIIDKDEEYLFNFKKSLNEINDEIKIYMFSNLIDYKKVLKDEEFDLVLIDSNIKTKMNGYITLSDNENFKNKDTIFKYKNIKSILNDIYIYLYNDELKIDNKENKFNDKNIIFFDVCNSKSTIKCINKFIENLSLNKKSFIWYTQMFDNFEENEGMDIIGAIYDKTFLNDKEFENKLKNINKNIFTFYPLKNKFEYLNLKQNEFEKLYSKIESENFINIFSIINGDINLKELFLINNSKEIYLIYDRENIIKKEQIKNFLMQYIKTNNLNVIINEFKSEDNEKKDIIRINNMVSN